MKNDSISTIISYGIIPLPSDIICKISPFFLKLKYGQTLEKYKCSFKNFSANFLTAIFSSSVKVEESSPRLL